MASNRNPRAVILKKWDNESRTYTETDEETGEVVFERPYDDTENQNADNEAQWAAEAAEREALKQQLVGGVQDIIAARDAAQADIATADALLAQANALVTQLDARLAAITAWTPSTTYKQSDLVAVKNEVLTILQRQKDITNAIGGLYAYRKANDQNAVMTDNSLLWLARLASDTLDVQTVPA